MLIFHSCVSLLERISTQVRIQFAGLVKTIQAHQRFLNYFIHPCCLLSPPVASMFAAELWYVFLRPHTCINIPVLFFGIGEDPQLSYLSNSSPQLFIPIFHCQETPPNSERFNLSHQRYSDIYPFLPDPLPIIPSLL